MKYWVVIFISAFILVFLSVKSQELGIQQTECGIITNPAYQITIFNLSPGLGWGINLIHNNKNIYWSGIAHPDSELKFINDSVGFMNITDQADPGGRMYKIMNNSLFDMGYSFEGTYFVVNSNYLYSNSGPEFEKLSDIEPIKRFWLYNLAGSDTLIYDTIKGSALCEKLDEIDYRFMKWNSADTFTLRIKLTYISTGISITKRNEYFAIYPNPAKEILHVSLSQPVLNCKFKIYNNLGVMVKQIQIDSRQDNQISIADIASGVYFIELGEGNLKQIHKFIKM